MKSTEAITYASIAVIAISLFFIGAELTGFATANSTGLVNVTIESSAEINFTTALLDFGSGTVTPGQIAVLDSEGTNTSWSGNATTGELILENIGNTNLTLQLKTDLSPADFIGGTSPTFQAKVANNTGNVGACTGTNIFTNYSNINTTMQTACGTLFGYEAAIDEIAIDFSMNISDDALGAKTVTITAVGTY
jgi:hypothetical protein